MDSDSYVFRLAVATSCPSTEEGHSGDRPVHATDSESKKTPFQDEDEDDDDVLDDSDESSWFGRSSSAVLVRPFGPAAGRLR